MSCNHNWNPTICTTKKTMNNSPASPAVWAFCWMSLWSLQNKRIWRFHCRVDVNETMCTHVISQNFKCSNKVLSKRNTQEQTQWVSRQEHGLLEFLLLICRIAPLPKEQKPFAFDSLAKHFCKAIGLNRNSLRKCGSKICATCLPNLHVCLQLHASCQMVNSVLHEKERAWFQQTCDHSCPLAFLQAFCCRLILSFHQTSSCLAENDGFLSCKVSKTIFLLFASHSKLSLQHFLAHSWLPFFASSTLSMLFSLFVWLCAHTKLFCKNFHCFCAFHPMNLANLGDCNGITCVTFLSFKKSFELAWVFFAAKWANSLKKMFVLGSLCATNSSLSQLQSVWKNKATEAALAPSIHLPATLTLLWALTQFWSS